MELSGAAYQPGMIRAYALHTEMKRTGYFSCENPLVQKALKETDPAKFSEWAAVLLDQALLAEEGSLKDPSGFLKRLNALLLS